MRESVAPIEHLRFYDKYDFLITRKAEQDADAFLAENHHYEKIIQERFDNFLNILVIPSALVKERLQELSSS